MPPMLNLKGSAEHLYDASREHKGAKLAFIIIDIILRHSLSEASRILKIHNLSLRGLPDL